MKEKTFRDTALYPILYMLVISLFFVGLLAVFYRSSEARIMAHAENEYNLLVVQLLSGSISEATGISADDLMKDIDATLETYIKPNTDFSRDAFLATVDGEPLAYLFDIKGKGLWGSMAALVTTDIQLSTIKDFAVYAQMETPGLGSRITEEAFRTQFRGKTALDNGEAADLTLVPEGQAEVDANQIRQITGATITSNSVLKMLKDELLVLHADMVGGHDAN